MQVGECSKLCETHATSKIQEISDLKNLSTCGFRGEALAIIAQVALLNVISRVREGACGWQARYENGAYIEASKISVAREVGTTIRV